MGSINGFSKPGHERNNEKNGINSDIPKFQPKIRWPDLLVQIFLHIGAIYGLVFQFYKIKLLTFLWCKHLKNQIHLLSDFN